MTGDQLAARIMLGVIGVSAALGAVSYVLDDARWLGYPWLAAGLLVTVVLVVVGIVALIMEAR